MNKKGEEEAEAEAVLRALEERIDTHDESRRKVQERLHEVCEKWRKKINELEDRTNSELEERSTRKTAASRLH